MPGLGPGIHDFGGAVPNSWMAGPSPAMTVEGLAQTKRHSSLQLHHLALLRLIRALAAVGGDLELAA